MEFEKIDVTRTDALLELADGVLETLKHYQDTASGWHVAKKTKEMCVDFRSSECENFSHGHLYRGQMEIKCPKDIVYEYVSPTFNGAALRVKWDRDVNTLNVLKEIDADTHIIQTKTNSAAMGLISPRDFVDLVRTVRTDDYISTNARSINTDAYPPEHKFVRGWNHPCGIVCKRHPDNPNYTQVISFVQPDIKGMLPRSLVESAIPGSMAGFFGNLKTILQKDKKLLD